MSQQSQNKKSQNSENFNFQDPLGNVNSNKDFSSYAKNKAENIQAKIDSKTTGTNSIWLLVFVLIISFASLSVFSFTQIQRKNQEIAMYERGEVAGISDGAVKNIIAGQDFSLVLDIKTPKGFNLDITQSNSPYLENQKTTQSTFINIIEKDGVDLISGVEILTTQNDGNLDLKKFGETVSNKLGDDYTLSESIIELSNNRTALKIDSSKIDGIAHYVSVTQENYYVIKVYNQTTKHPDLVEYSRFSDIILSSLYLN